MPHIHYLPDKKEIETKENETILEASLRNGIPHAHSCGGNARCSVCRVLILEGLKTCALRNEKEQKVAEHLHFGPEIRLACQTTVAGDVRLRRLVLDDEDVELTSQLKGGTPSPAGEEKELAILFADIRGFTSFAETLLPYDVVYVLNRYFHEMDQVISCNSGYIDNYMGDGLIALFGVDDSANAALNAIRAGLGMLKAVKYLKPYLETIYAKSFQIGIGLHYGEVVLGTVGARNLKKLTAIGDAVNFASRIEALTKNTGTNFLVSEAVYTQVKDQVCIGKSTCMEVAGKCGEHNLYEVVGIK
ncbi:MAG: adenylate/guanylate cyclase domain-containing protein [Actinobacteria bacterium]|nr:adenylate/guanylate cyclase domain-containing protein [Actinomycetota bacterium]